MEEIVFVTHNKGKAKSAEKYFDNLKISTYDFELDEPRSDDVKEIATAKVMQAYKVVGKPCIALDTGFFIEALNGFPRAFVNFSLDTIGIDGILKLMQGKENRKCKFEECLAYYDGKEVRYFYGKHPGNLATKMQGVDRMESGQICGMCSNLSILIRLLLKWMMLREKTEERLMVRLSR